LIDLAELKIYGLNEKWGDEESGADALELMREVYKTVLSNDYRWHFFWEGDYTVIRCDPFYANTVDNYFSEFKDFTVMWKEGGYEENIPITKKYIEAFIHVFHGYSILALEMDDDDFIGILERNNHCFLNMVTRDELVDRYAIPGDQFEVHKGMGWEAVVLSHVANLRMYTCGWLYGLFERKKRQDGKQKD
jgi:hypothetical protein